jgi:hypothetical protein
MESLHIKQHTPDTSQNTQEASNPQLESLLHTIDQGVQEYQIKLRANSFTEGEKEHLQERLTTLVEKAKKVKAGESITSGEQSISHHYQYTNPQTNQIEHQEDIHLDIEQSIQEHLSLYQKTHIDLPPDFTQTIREIWNTNYDHIQEAIQEHGFNALLVAPGNIPLAELSEKMKMENGYYDGIKSNATVTTLDNLPLTSTGTDKPRLILYHAKSLPNIHSQNGIDPHLNITTQDAQTLYDTHPDHYLATLEDAILLEHAHFEKTGQHISDWNIESAQWLPGTKQPTGSRFVYSGWSPGNSRLFVYASGADISNSYLGCRPSRYFY